MRLAAGLVLAAVAATARPACAGEGWMRFRGPNGSAVSSETPLPTTWSATENVVWKTAMPGAGTSSPIVVGERVFLTSFSGHGVPGEPSGSMNRLKRTVVCVGRKDGKILWTRDVKARLPEQERTRDNHGYASSTPVSDGERLYVFFGKGGVSAFDLEGKQLWRGDVGSGLSGWGSAASPVLHGETLIVNASVEGKALVALNKATGKRRWLVRDIREAWNTPLLAAAPGGRTELVVAVPRHVRAYDPATGEELWSCQTGITWYMVPSMVAHGGIVYCIGGRSGTAASMAIRQGGRGDVTATHRLWKTDKWSNVSSPIYHDGRLYFAHEKRAVAYCLNAGTGEVLYERQLGPRAGQVYASPVLADGKIYYVTRRGGTFVVAAGPEFKQLAHNTLDDRSTFNASPAVSGRCLLLRSDRFLYCIGKR